MVNSAPVAERTGRRRRLARERGASEVFMLLMIIPLLLFAGLAYDAGMAFTARRSATNTAAAAARAGADQVEEDIIYLTGCLLYTSPSPRDATLSRMPSSA